MSKANRACSVTLLCLMVGSKDESSKQCQNRETTFGGNSSCVDDMPFVAVRQALPGNKRCKGNSRMPSPRSISGVMLLASELVYSVGVVPARVHVIVNNGRETLFGRTNSREQVISQVFDHGHLKVLSHFALL